MLPYNKSTTQHFFKSQIEAAKAIMYNELPVFAYNLMMGCLCPDTP